MPLLQKCDGMIFLSAHRQTPERFNASPAHGHRGSAMPHRNTLVIATHNVDKVSEIADILKDFSVILKNLKDFGPIPHFQENGRTFEENAYHKASFTARILGFPALADDSGLVVEALNGAPGIYSARYAGEHATDAHRCAKVLREMKGKINRKARFECVISIAVPTGYALTYESKVDGWITDEPIGSNGFGYDPIFYYPPLGKTFAQLTRDEKNAVSHRGKALMELRDEFDKVLIWIDRHMPVFEKTAFNHDNHAL